MRFSLDAGDLDMAEQVARAAHLVASKNGDFETFHVSAIHATGLIADDSDGLLLAAVAVPVDVTPETYCIDPAAAEAAITALPVSPRLGRRGRRRPPGHRQVQPGIGELARTTARSSC